jgi:Tfp pilus assembly protein PilZ
VACFKGVLGLGQNVAVAIHNLSEEGACVLVRVALERGQEVELHLESLQHRRPIKVAARVVWVSPMEKDAWLIGLHFQRSLPYKEVQALGET